MTIESYEQELLDLQTAFNAALVAPLDAELNAARILLADRNLVAVGSGGAGPLATLAAQSHVETTGREARAVPPLLFLQETHVAREEVVIIFSAQARHRDTRSVVNAARDAGRSVILVSQRSAAELGPTYEGVLVIRVPTVPARDGFLATRSIASMAAVVARLYTNEDLSGFRFSSVPNRPSLKPNVLVLHGRNERAAAEDIEVRISELGLAAVQLADYRSLGHGRHFGLSRRIDVTTVLALMTPQSKPLAQLTIEELPPEISVVELESSFSGLLGRIDLLAAAAYLPIAAAGDQNVKPSNPRVPDFGRRLYHLAVDRSNPAWDTGPIARKVEALGTTATNTDVTRLVRREYLRWRREAIKKRFKTVVCDYDGTVVETNDRFKTPASSVQGQILRLLEADIGLVFASGRGDSLRESLVTWIPKHLRKGVTLGLHSGAWIIGLDSDDFEETTELSEAVRRLIDRVVQDLSGVTVRHSNGQSSLASSKVDLSLEALRTLIDSVIQAEGGHDNITVVRSGHSVDVIAGLGKVAVLETLDLNHTLIIGDQGKATGNDGLLLSASRWTLSVDECSAALDRCWSVSNGPISGPPAFERILKSLESHGDGVKLNLAQPHV